MEHKVIKGAWEEVARRADELAGHRVRITVLDDFAVPEASNGNQAGDSAPSNNPIMGMFRDAPDLMDQLVEDAMRIREERPWRLPAGE